MNWKIPLFWYACFAPTDKIELDDESGPYPAYFTSAQSALANLERRRDLIMGLMPDDLRADYNALLDRFIARFGEGFKEGVFLDVTDFFALMEFDPQALSAFADEVALMEVSPADGGAESLMDFTMSGAFDIGEEPAPSDRSKPEELATYWRYMLTGGPMSEDPSWPGAPSEAEITRASGMLERAAKRRAETEGAVTSLPNAPAENAAPPTKEKKKKPWWKFF